MTQQVRGVLWLTASFVVWGFSPLFWKLLGHVAPLEVMAHRTIWSAVCLAPLLLSAKLREEGRALLVEHPSHLLWLALSSFLIVYNWYNFVTAMLTKQVLQSSLGYFLNPLLTIFLGLVLLREPLRRVQAVALVLACVAVGYLVVVGGELPALALVLASTFAVYGFIRKRVPVSGLLGVLVETAMASVFIVPWLIARGGSDHDWQTWVLLLLSGPFTAVPLIWYIWGVQAIPLSLSGIYQFSVPILQFLLAVFLYDEPFDSSRKVAFGLIWAALVLWMGASFRRR